MLRAYECLLQTEEIKRVFEIYVPRVIPRPLQLLLSQGCTDASCACSWHCWVLEAPNTRCPQENSTIWLTPSPSRLETHLGAPGFPSAPGRRAEWLWWAQSSPSREVHAPLVLFTWQLLEKSRDPGVYLFKPVSSQQKG